MKKIKQIIAIMIFFSIPFVMTAQPPHPNNGGGLPGPGNEPVGGEPCGVPIDGGLSVLLALGLAYGAKKVYQLRKEE